MKMSTMISVKMNKDIQQRMKQQKATEESFPTQIPSKSNFINSKDTIQNDLTAWAVTVVPPQHERFYSQTRIPWQYIRPTTLQRERPTNRVPATKIPHHKVTALASDRNNERNRQQRMTKPGPTESLNEYEKESNKHRKYKNDGQVSFETKFSPRDNDASKLSITNELPYNEDKMHGNPRDFKFTDSIKVNWLPMTTAPSPFGNKSTMAHSIDEYIQ